MSFNPEADDRTCLACGEPVSPSVRGYLGSLRGCEDHLQQWRDSKERFNILLDQVAGRDVKVVESFAAWAEKKAGAP